MSGLPVIRREPADAAVTPVEPPLSAPPADPAPGEESLSDLVYAQLVAIRDRLLGK